MLANALLCVALIAFTAETILSAGLMSVRTTIHRLAASYLAHGYQRAIDALESSVADYARAGPIASPLPTLTPVPPACVDSGNPCAYTSSATIVLLRSDAGINEQANAYVNEGRILAHVSVIVRAADGTMLASRDSDVVLRTMNAPPYVAIAGARDATFDDVVPDGSAGDDGGAPPATANPCEPASRTTDDTVVRVAYQNAQTGACTDGSSWRTPSEAP